MSDLDEVDSTGHTALQLVAGAGHAVSAYGQHGRKQIAALLRAAGCDQGGTAAKTMADDVLQSMSRDTHSPRRPSRNSKRGRRLGQKQRKKNKKKNKKRKRE